MKKWMLSVVLPIIGILGLWLFPAQEVNAETTTHVHVGSATLNSTNNYTTDGVSAIPDPGDGNRATGYALFDAVSSTLKLQKFSTSNIDHSLDFGYHIWANCDLNLILEDNNVLASNNSTCSDDFEAIYVDGKLTITGSGSLTIENQSVINGCSSSGINAEELVLDGGNINVNGITYGLYSQSDLSLNGGKLEATGTVMSIWAAENIILGNMMSIKTPQGGTIESHDFGGEYI